MIHGGSRSVRPVKGKDKVGAPAPDKGGSSGGGEVVRAQREGPDFLENRRLIIMDVDSEDPIQTLHDDVVTYLRGLEKGIYGFTLDGEARDIPVTVLSEGGYNEFYIELMSSSTYTDHLILWINLEDFYIVGFRRRTKNGQWIGLWQEYEPKERKKIEGSTQLSFGSKYSDMYQAIMGNFITFDSEADMVIASEDFHSTLPIGRDALKKAFLILTAPDFYQDSQAALSLMVLSTMVCESLRLKKCLARLKSAFSQNKDVPFCETDHQLVWMWGTSSHVFNLACTSPDNTRLDGIRALMPGGIKETLLQEIGILKCLDKHGKRFCGQFRRDYVKLLEARGQTMLH